MLSAITNLDLRENNALEFLKSNLSVFTYVSTENLTLDNLEILEFLVETKDSIFLEIICSGYGATAFEPDTPCAKKIQEGLQWLLSRGFPTENIRLYLTPVICNAKGFKKAEEVVNSFKSYGVTKIRMSGLMQSSQQKYNLRNKFGTEIKEDLHQYCLKELALKFAMFCDVKFCEYEKQSCTTCITPNLHYQLHGIIGSKNTCEACDAVKITRNIDMNTMKHFYYRR